MNKLLFLVITGFIIFACSHENPSAPGVRGSSEGGDTETAQRRGAKTGALDLIPKEATVSSTLHLVSRGIDLSREKIEWLVNGRSVATRMPTQFDGADAAKGDTVQARVVMQDLAVESNSVTIMNSRPEISGYSIMPENFKAGDTLSIEAFGEDRDGDTVSFVYEWTKNGVTAGKENKIGSPVKRGDKIAVRITPYDGTDYGIPELLEREIGNLPPMIENHNEFSFDGNVYLYQVKSSDPDDDPLVYSLETTLDGMTIDSSTGLFQWTVPPDFMGDKNVTVVVADGHGGVANYILKISIQQQPSKETVVPDKPAQSVK